MRKWIFGLLACAMSGCTGNADTVGADDDLDQRYAAIVAEACIEHGQWGSTPETLTRNCGCVGDVMSRFIPVDMQTHAVQTGRYDDSDWAKIRGTPAESRIAEALYEDCAMSYALIQQWPQ